MLNSLIIGMLGQNVLEVYRILVLSAFGSLDDFGYVLFNATPLIFTGLAVTIAFKCGLFNIGCEGQLYVGGFAAAWVGFHFNFPAIILIPLCVLAAMVAGAGWAAVAGILKAKFGVHEVINTIMMNFIAIALTSYLVAEIYQEAGQMTPQTPPISDTAHLPRIATFLAFIPKSNPLNVAFLLALLVTLFCQFFLKRTQYGYELKLVGDAPEVATYGGVHVGAVTVWTMMLSGAIASLAGVWDVMGYRHRFLDNFSPGFGYTGIAAALLGRNHPYAVLFAAILLGALNKGALDVEIWTNVPRELFLIIQAVLILCLASIQFKWHAGPLSKTT
ncbi:MAG: ABC transporter permease [Candidatus Poribacteria bacterium]|nr:ABC transporter permease [Candidatus Poribacteria bacterium]